MNENKYYDGTKLLSLKDINGNTPELFLCTTNRSGGKTTYFNRLAMNRFVKNGSKFGLIYRFNYELDNVSEKFFKDIGKLFFPDIEFTDKRKASGIYHELYANDVNCGYAITLNSADQIKKLSHLFSDIDCMIFDEFQSETNHYCPNEVKKFISVHTSIARGNHKQVRYVPVYMLSNPVTILNPYYVELGISNRLKSNTKFLRGDGFVLENGFIETASKAQKDSAFNRAFAKNAYVSYSAESVYLNDNKAFIEKMSGNSVYIMTLRYKGCDYAIREYDSGIVYIDNRPDSTFKYKITVTADDHTLNYVMLKRNDFMLEQLRWYFERGVFRFRNLQCKEALLSALSYKL